MASTCACRRWAASIRTSSARSSIRKRRDVPRGATGELCTRGYSVMLGYWNNAEATAASIDTARWMHTGDLAVMHDDGYVHISGRSKDMIIRGGDNIYLREIEEFLYTHPKVSDVQVIGVPDASTGGSLRVDPAARGRARRSKSARILPGADCHQQDPALHPLHHGVPPQSPGRSQKFRMREISIEELGLPTLPASRRPDARGRRDHGGILPASPGPRHRSVKWCRVLKPSRETCLAAAIASRSSLIEGSLASGVVARPGLTTLAASSGKAASSLPAAASGASRKSISTCAASPTRCPAFRRLGAQREYAAGVPGQHRACRVGEGLLRPSKITYGQLLKIFFAVAHDPTQKGGQGPDVGTDTGRSFSSPTNTSEHRRRLHRPAHCRGRLQAEHHHAGRPVDRVLRGRGVPPGLRRAQPDPALHRDQRPAEGRSAEEAVSTALRALTHPASIYPAASLRAR